MTLVFGNGGTPSGNNPYVGLSYTTAIELITHIHDVLVSAGWTLVSGSIAGANITMEGTSSAGNCRTNFTASAGILSVAVGISSIVTSALTYQYSTGASNTIFITADTHAGAIANFPSSGVGEVGHFGFPNLIYSNDSTAIYCGKAFTMADTTTYPVTMPSGSNTAYDLCQVVSAAFSGGPTLLGDAYSNSATASPLSTGVSYPVHTTFNINSGVRGMAAGNLPSSSTNTNTAYFGHIGGNDTRSNLPIAGPYYYLEGRGSSTSYGNTLGTGIAPTLNMRGLIPFLATGFSHLSSFTQWNTSSNKVYITGDIGFQGMRIA